MNRRRWLRGVVVDVVLVAGWLASAAAVVLHERGQLLGGAVNPAATLRVPFGLNEQWFGLYYQGHKIGYARTSVVPSEREGVPGLAVSDDGRFAFTLLGVPQRVQLSVRAFIDADWRVQTVDASLRSDASTLTWSGRRQGDGLALAISSGSSRTTVMLREPGGGAVVAGLSPWTAFRHLRVGQWGSVWIINPLALKPERVYFHVRRQVPVEGRSALVVETEFRGLTTTSWVTADGEVLREESPLGWELVRETMQQALRTPEAAPSADLLSTTAVPIDRCLDSPERITRMVWLVEGAAADTLAVSRPWQQVLPENTIARFPVSPPAGEWCVLELRRPAVPLGAATAGAPARYQRPSVYVQSEDPAIIRAARDAAGDADGPWAQAEALSRWVHQALTKRLTVGLPSAVDVLALRSGDCHEHTVLFAALARSLGIPTRLVAGLVYYDGRLFYHAWPEVWVGGAWVPTDPTLGQPVADATHVALTEAEDEALMELSRFVGRLRVRVLALEEEAP